MSDKTSNELFVKSLLDRYKDSNEPLTVKQASYLYASLTTVAELFLGVNNIILDLPLDEKQRARFRENGDLMKILLTTVFDGMRSLGPGTADE